MTPIAWQRLAAAIEYYGNLGYKYTDVPWIVDLWSHARTCPLERAHLVSRDNGDDLGALVGSAEQGFISLWANNKLPSDLRLMAVTPCFRTEDSYDDKLVLPWFMKLELWAVGHSPLELAHEAQKFMQRWYHPIDLVETVEGWDLQHRTIEVGSYGSRIVDGFTYTYGTGLAEPRFTNLRGLV
jgi:hypothetical protein